MPSGCPAQRFPRDRPGGSPSTWTRVPPAQMTTKFSRYWFFRLTFRPRFAKSRNCLRIQTLKKHLGQKSTSFCREFRCASSWHSHLIRLLTFWKKKSSGDSNWQNMTKLTIYMLKKSGGVIFLRSPKRRRQRPPDAQGWGSQSGVKTVSKEDFE